MAIASARISSWENESGIATLAYNDANNAVQSVTVANNSSKTARVTVWQTDNPAVTVTQELPPRSLPYTFTNLGGNIRYSPVELPEGSNKATNVGFRLELY